MTIRSLHTTSTPYSRYGVDVAVRRADDLDKLMLDDIQKNHQPVAVLDLGAGAGGQSRRLVQAGARVHAIDVGAYEEEFLALQEELRVGEQELRFSCADICHIIPTLRANHYHCICFQRTIHYLTYADAHTLLCNLATLTTGRLYISVTGQDSAIGHVHPQGGAPIEERFTTLPTDAAETFSIHSPLCVYTKDEFCKLLTESGWVIERVWVSAFGNIKAVAVPHT